MRHPVAGAGPPSPLHCTTVVTKGTGRYGRDVLAGDWRRPGKGAVREIPLARDLVVEASHTNRCQLLDDLETEYLDGEAP